MGSRWESVARRADAALVSDHDYRGLGVGRLMSYKARVLAEYAYMRASSPSEARARLKETRAARGTAKGRAALVAGLGPSLKDIDGAAVAEAQRSGSLSVFALNNYHLTPLSRIVTPDYYVLADPWFFTEENWSARGDGEGQGLLGYLRSRPATSLVLPADIGVTQSLADRQVLYFNHLALESWSRNIDPTKPRAFLSMTVMHSLSMAIHLGFSPIYLVGADSDMFRKVNRLPDGVLHLGDGFHAYPDPGGITQDLFDGDAAAFLEDAARVIADFRLFADADIRVLARSSLLDAFPVDASSFQSADDAQ